MTNSKLTPRKHAAQNAPVSRHVTKAVKAIKEMHTTDSSCDYYVIENDQIIVIIYIMIHQINIEFLDNKAAYLCHHIWFYIFFHFC